MWLPVGKSFSQKDLQQPSLVMVFCKDPNARHTETEGLKNKKQALVFWFCSPKIQNASNKNATASEWQRAREKPSLQCTGMIN